MSDGKRVVIVKGGQWGDATPEDYDWVALIVKKLLEEKTVGQGKEEKIFASIEIVNGIKEARKAPYIMSDIFIFLSQSQAEEAKALKKGLRSRAKVIVYSGRIPDDEIIWMSKRWSL